MNKNIKTVDANQLLNETSSGKDMAVINVLGKEYFDDCHIKGSININYERLEESVKDWDRTKNIVVYCASYDCHASAEAYKKLVEMGFTNVRAYEGGIKEWCELGYTHEGPCKESYLTQPLLKEKKTEGCGVCGEGAKCRCV